MVLSDQCWTESTNTEQNSHFPSSLGDKQFDQTGLVLGFLRQVHANICTLQRGHPACDDRLDISDFRNVCGSMLCRLHLLLLSMLARTLAAKHSLKEAQRFCPAAVLEGEDCVTMETTETTVRTVSATLGERCSFSLREGQVSGVTEKWPQKAHPVLIPLEAFS